MGPCTIVYDWKLIRKPQSYGARFFVISRLEGASRTVYGSCRPSGQCSSAVEQSIRNR